MIYDFEEQTPRLNEEFAEYLDGKSVAIVGRDGICDVEQGEFIDSHEVVVRIHQVIPYNPDYNEQRDTDREPLVTGHVTPEHWRPIVGTKRNIWYTRVRRLSSKYCRRWVELFREAGGVFVCNDSLADPKQVGEAYLDRFIAVRYLSWEFRNELALRMEKLTGKLVVPLSGTTIICDIARHNVKSIYITGFPMYYEIGKKDMLKLTAHAPHYEDLKFLSELAKDDRVTCDPLMASLFERHCY